MKKIIIYQLINKKPEKWKMHSVFKRDKGCLHCRFNPKGIEPFIKNYLYYPGPDMGTDDNDLLKIFNIVGLPNLAPKKIGLF